jgi:hypothetical protein
LRLVLVPLALVAAASASAAEAPAMSAQLQALVKNRTEAPAVRCIRRDVRMRTRIVDADTIAFQSGSAVVFVNRPQSCPLLRPGRSIVNEVTSGNVCEGDVIGIVDLVSDVEYGSCNLSAFTPWLKQK